jgi:hypothetical protein
MMIDPGLIAGVAGCSAALFSLLALRKYQLIAARESARLSDESERRQDLCSGQIAGLRNDLVALELSLYNTEEILRDGRLNRSTRAQAMKLLRSGISPETAASTLGMATREMKLLATVSRLLLPHAPSS